MPSVVRNLTTNGSTEPAVLPRRSVPAVGSKSMVPWNCPEVFAGGVQPVVLALYFG